MNFQDFRQLAAEVRQLPLEAVLRARGAVQDGRDQHKWHTQQGPVSISGAQFMNWRRAVGGGGAIDLALHLGEPNYRAAVLWLARNVAGGAISANAETPRSCRASSSNGRKLRLPVRNDGWLPRVLRYLVDERRLPAMLLNSLIDRERWYADDRANAVFLLVAGQPNRPVGAELRGTGARPWRGMAAGSSKDAGFFWIGDDRSPRIVLCESAIDAISCHALDGGRICISTAGARPHPRWLTALINRGYQIHCGFDADSAGDTAAAAMIAAHPSIRRLRPSAKDWNDVLTRQL
jgi:hypothetical protein